MLVLTDGDVEDVSLKEAIQPSTKYVTNLPT
jgi:hypothetical protein